jgi:hypothetical protein
MMRYFHFCIQKENYEYNVGSLDNVIYPISLIYAHINKIVPTLNSIEMD